MTNDPSTQGRHDARQNASSQKMMRIRESLYNKIIAPHAVPVAILVLLTLAVYIRTLGHDFQLFWDDEKYVTANDAVQGLTLSNLKTVFTSFYTGNYAPVQMMSYMVDYTVWGLTASGFFLTNIIIHMFNGILFYALLIRLEFRRLWAFFSAFIFLLHPVQVETVAWISERKNLLAIFFCLLAFVAYLTYREKGWKEGKLAYFISFVAFILALLSKSVVVVFPLVLIFYDYCYLDKQERGQWLIDKIPFAIAAAVMVWLTMQGQLPGEIPGTGGGRTTYHGGSPFATFLTMMVVLGWYARILVWPTGLSAIYDPPVKTAIDGKVIGGGFLLALLVSIGIFLFRRQRRLFFWYGLFFIGLLPVSQIVPIVTLMNDRYLYFPMLGAAACLGGLAVLADRYSGARRVATVAALGLVLASLPCLSYSRAGVWQNDLTLWRDAAEKSPKHYVALYGWGQALQNSGDLDSARSVYLRVLALNPRHLDTLIHLGALYRTKNMPLQGRPYLLDATRYYPTFSKGYYDLGMNYYASDELVEAEKAMQKALSLKPRWDKPIIYLGMISLRTGRIDAARNYFNDAVAVGSTNADIEYNRACVEALAGDSGKALKHLESALRLGFRDRESIEKDPDLASIRTLPDFRRITDVLDAGR